MQIPIGDLIVRPSFQFSFLRLTALAIATASSASAQCIDFQPLSEISAVPPSCEPSTIVEFRSSDGLDFDRCVDSVSACEYGTAVVRACQRMTRRCDSIAFHGSISMLATAESNR